MRGILALCVFFSLTGCLAGAQQASSSTTVTYDTGVPGLERTTYVSKQSGRYIGGQIPMMMPGGGMVGYGGYGPMTVTSGSCWRHPDECPPTIERVTYVQPMNVVSDGGRGSADGSVASVDVEDLRAEIAQLQSSVKKLKGVAKMTIEQSCTIVIGNAGAIPAHKRDGMVAACTRILNVNPNTAHVAEEN